MNWLKTERFWPFDPRALRLQFVPSSVSPIFFQGRRKIHSTNPSAHAILLISCIYNHIMNNKPHPREDSLGYILGRAGRALGTRVNRCFVDQGHNVTCEQWVILANLKDRNGQSQNELAAQGCKDKTSMTRIIDGMEKKSLVVRIPDKADKRQKLIYLTNKGKEVQQKLLAVVHQVLKEAEHGIHARDMRLCKDVLNKVYANLAEFNQKTSVVTATNRNNAKG